MAITTYAELQTSAATWLVRGDLTARIPDFISLAEAHLNRVLRARLAEMDVSLTGVVGSRFIPLPVAYSEALTVWITYPSGTDRQELKFVDPASLDTTTIQGAPLGWTIDGANLAFERPCDQAYAFTFRCIEKYALSDAVPTNSLLTDYPDAYLYAVLDQATPYLRDPDLAAAYNGRLGAAVKEINAKDARSRAQQNLTTEPGELQRMGRRSGFDIRRGF